MGRGKFGVGKREGKRKAEAEDAVGERSELWSYESERDGHFSRSISNTYGIGMGWAVGDIVEAREMKRDSVVKGKTTFRENR